jgi:cell division protein FtsN
MSRDYKPKSIPQSKPRTGGNLLIGIFVGLLLGLAIAVGVAWYMNHSQIPFVNKFKPADRANPAINEPGPTSAPGLNATGTNTTANGLPPPVGAMPGQGTGAATTPDKVHLDFYNILKGTEEPVSKQQIEQAEAAPGTIDTGKVKFLLQAGSFPNGADAENLKARLALIGVEASVQSADLGAKGVWNRVLIGPYARIEDTTKLRALLAQNGIEASLIKLKDTAGR